MITNYPEKATLKEVLSTSLSITALKNICKNNGVFLLSSDKETVIRDAHLFYWGLDDINLISNQMEDAKNYKKSFRLKLQYEPSAEAEDKNAFLEMYSVLSNYRNSMASTDQVSFESLNIVTNNGQQVLVGEISYKKRKPGKVELLSEVTQQFSFQVKTSDTAEVDIDFIFNDRSDVAIAKKLVNNAIVTSQSLKPPTQISLKPLKTSERVELYDKFFDYGFQDWRRISIEDIKISDGQEDNENEDEEELTQNILSGIKSAHLSGTALRTNPFVIQAVDKGYFFNKSTIRFEHKREAQQILIDVAFNSDDLLLEISMITTFEVEDDRPYKHPMLVDDQKIILEEFHDVIQVLYGQILAARQTNNVTELQAIGS